MVESIKPKIVRKPLGIADLRNKLLAATDHTHTIATTGEKGIPDQAVHLLDWFDGLRMHVAFELLKKTGGPGVVGGDEVRLHVWGAVMADTLLGRRILAMPAVEIRGRMIGDLTVASLFLLAEARFQLFPQGIDQHGKPHFIGPTHEEWKAMLAAVEQKKNPLSSKAEKEAP